MVQGSPEELARFVKEIQKQLKEPFTEAQEIAINEMIDRKIAEAIRQHEDRKVHEEVCI